MKELCHRKVLVDGAQNRFRHLVLPLSFSSEPLLHAVIAVSANDLRNRNDKARNPRLERKLLYHKSKSLGALRGLFDGHDDTTDIAQRDSMLLAVLMHCNLEIASGSRHEWTSHLKGARSVIQYHQERTQQAANQLFSAAILEFVHDYFSIRDIFSATALSQSTHWSLQLPSSSPRSWMDMTSINVDIGLSQELLDIISSITILARLKFHLRRMNASRFNQESLFLDSAHALQQRLDNLQQWSSEPDPDHLLYLNAAAFKAAAYIYLRHGAFDDPPHATTIQNSHLPTLLTLLQRIHSKQGEGLGTAPYPMWALFIASCVVEEEDRATTLGYFTELKRYRPVSNVPTTMKAVEAVWKMKDLEAARKDREVKRTAFEWEDALGRLGWQMPLT